MKFSNVLVETSENIYEEICEVLRRFKIIIELCVGFHSQLCFSFSIYIIAEIVVMGKRM